jgi:hypothetical protein
MEDLIKACHRNGDDLANLYELEEPMKEESYIKGYDYYIPTCWDEVGYMKYSLSSKDDILALILVNVDKKYILKNKNTWSTVDKGFLVVEARLLERVYVYENRGNYVLK